MKDVKLLLILHLPPPVHGASLVGSFIQESVIINGKFNCCYINLGTSADISSIGRSSLSKWLRFAQIKWQVLRKLISFKPDLVYMTLTAKGTGFYKDAIIALFVKSFGVKVVYHFHNKGVAEFQHRGIDNALYRRVFRNAHVILLSELLANDVVKYVPQEHVKVCPNGIPDTHEVKQYAALPSDKPVRLIFLSNLLVAKGLFVLLDACVHLMNRGVSFQINLIGNEGDINTQSLADAIQNRGLQNYVTYLGSITGTEKDQQYSDHDIFVLPSLNECMPLVLIEAMRAGLPVVTTYVGAIPDVVLDGETGILVPPNDAECLAEAIFNLANDPAMRQRMGTNGRNRYLDHYTLEKFEQRFVDILQEIATSTRN